MQNSASAGSIFFRLHCVVNEGSWPPPSISPLSKYLVPATKLAQLHFGGGKEGRKAATERVRDVMLASLNAPTKAAGLESERASEEQFNFLGS